MAVKNLIWFVAILVSEIPSSMTSSRLSPSCVLNVAAGVSNNCNIGNVNIWRDGCQLRGRGKWRDGCQKPPFVCCNFGV